MGAEQDLTINADRRGDCHFAHVSRARQFWSATSRWRHQQHRTAIFAGYQHPAIDEHR